MVIKSEPETTASPESGVSVPLILVDGVTHVPSTPGKVYRTRMPQEPPPHPPEDRDTLPKCFLVSVREYGDKTAMRKKRLGIWMEYTWNEVHEHVTNFC